MAKHAGITFPAFQTIGYAFNQRIKKKPALD
jgi:hypothetical protein